MIQTSGYLNPHIRGVGALQVGPGQENSVAMYVDGVYISSGAASLMSLLDVSQVSVLKGPQGTLFGRNASAGVIQVTTRDPSPSFRYSLRISPCTA